MILTDATTRQTLRNAIFKICGSENPTRRCLDNIGRDAARLAGRGRPWGGSWLYTLMHLERYNHDRVKYGVNPDLLNAVMQLAKMEVVHGKQSVNVYASRVREGSIVFGKSRKCARWRCGVWFVSDTTRLYCSDNCERKIKNFRRRQIKRIEKGRTHAHTSRHQKRAKRTARQSRKRA
jgi:hypothetical protein